MKSVFLLYRNKLSSSLLLIGVLFLSTPHFSLAAQYSVSTNGTAFATVEEPNPHSIYLPEWPELVLNEQTIQAISSSNTDHPFQFSFGGTPFFLYTVSIESQTNTISSGETYFELSNGVDSVGFFDETGLQSLQLKLLLEKALSQLTGLGQINIIIEHN